MIIKRTRAIRILVLPPLFTNSSHCLPLQVQPKRYSKCYNVHPSVTAYSFLFGVKLRDVFIFSFLRASHQPATFCAFPQKLLLLIFAFLFTAIVYKLPLCLSRHIPLVFTVFLNAIEIAEVQI